ncbi:class I SAM-dependent methyltransferase [Priestia koreensis]|uniref:class I SAM-dependent methyltransferase n=1 Tax=Priestia koreensis TaxID=284581 RepID=UPI001F57284A|nr:class I SAM-dependent methyltransferase [Priestia koreensis]UNL83720.1 class I SAM-dependent methyltransferase [Priestia koreensis]
MKNTIDCYSDVLEMLDSLLRDPEPFWEDFYTDRTKPIPIFTDYPDETLVSYVRSVNLTGRKVLDIGCGAGRNALFLASQGFEVDAIDLSSTSIEWAKERADERNLSIRFIHGNLFETALRTETYDLIYDSGCFHHLAPHRRITYNKLVTRVLKTGGHFGITCFVPGGKFGGSTLSDWEVYELRTLQGGLGYTKERLIDIFNQLQIIDARAMNDVRDGERLFGSSDLLSALFIKAN